MDGFVIYKATNLVNGKMYIGKSKNFDERKKSHRRDTKNGDQVYFHRALRKYGTENFDWQVIDQAETDQELDDKEKYWVQFYKSFDPQFGYNLTKGGDGGSPNEETRRKIGTANKGKIRSIEVKEKLSVSHRGCRNNNYGKSPSYSTRKKLSLALLGCHPTEETRQKMSESQKIRFHNHPYTEEEKLRKSCVLKGKSKSPAEQDRLRSLRKGTTISEDHRKKLHEGYLRYLERKRGGGE